MTDPISEWLANHPTAVSDFLIKYPTKAKWLDDIIDALLREPRGTAHIRTLAHKFWRSEKRDISSIEETITRCINNFCSDAADFNKSPAHDLFERVAAATYRLRSFPEKPDIYELITIHFVDPAMEEMWREFSTLCKQKFRERWKAAPNRIKLGAFVKSMSGPAREELYQRRRALAQ